MEASMSVQQKTLSQWIAAATVLPVTLCMFGHVYGQGTGSEAVFQGRPAMAGAQGGTGAMAGPPQGGVSPQSVDQAGGGLVLRRPGENGTEAPLPRDPGVGTPGKGSIGVPGNTGELKPRRDRDATGGVVKRERDATGTGNSTTSKAKRGAKRSLERAKRGVSGVDS
jgi:hypothetical protein